MSTRFSHDLTYDASMADVDAMLMDASFRERACDAQGAIRRPSPSPRRTRASPS